MGTGRDSLTLLGRRGATLADRLAPAVLLLASLWEIWVHTLFAPGIAGPRGLETAGAVAYSAGLLLRRRAPLATLALVIAGNAAQLPFVSPSQQTGLEGFLALLLAVFSVGAYAQRRRGLAAVLATIAAIAAGDATRAASNVGTDAGLYVLLAALWLFGDALRHHALRHVQLARHASELDRRRAEDADAAVADERARIARELHDVVAHSLGVMVIQTGAARQLLRADPDVACAQLLSAENTGREALAEMRRLLGIVRDGEAPALAPQPSLAHVDLLVEQVRAAGLDVRLRVEGDRRPLAPGVDLSAYRIVQEALTNTVKHAGPASAQVLVRYGDDDVEIEVSDDGRGVAAPAAPLGHGLVGMRERVALYGGALTAEPDAAKGFRVRARLPLDGVLR